VVLAGGGAIGEEGGVVVLGEERGVEGTSANFLTMVRPRRLAFRACDGTGVACFVDGLERSW